MATRPVSESTAGLLQVEASSLPPAAPPQGRPQPPPPPARRASRPRFHFGLAVGVPSATLLIIVTGVIFTVSAQTRELAAPLWMTGLVVTGGWVVWRTVVQAIGGHFATDIVASMAIITAVVVGQPLPGLIVVLMQTGGEFLESYARRRASRSVRALEEATPRTAHRVDGDSTLVDISADEIEVDDTLLIRPGELVPCDSTVLDGSSDIDTSQITGEPVPVRVSEGSTLLSGTANGNGSLRVRATARASESQYARIVELVRSAQASKAPLQRMADRYAIWFTPITIALCILVYYLTGDSSRVLAILVVATPCPLILAAPVAIIGGINSAARSQVIFRDGGALEQLGGTRTGVFDKTGTLTVGLPAVTRAVSLGAVTPAELLRLAATVEQASGHLLARTLVKHATDAGGPLPAPTHVTESPGHGVVGSVGGRDVAVGARSYMLRQYPSGENALAELDSRSVGLRAYVALDGTPAGVIEYEDRLRPGVAEFFAELHELGFRQTVLLSGDDEARTREIASEVGIDEAHGELLPGEKAAFVRELVARGDRILMVGDGTNDAPALGTATVGIALAGHGGGITAEAADVVILVDDLSRVTSAIRISRRTIRIARESIWVGLGLSGVAMVFAALGMITPIAGALLQEAIDVAVIVNALRASRT
jgi:heavy metal translocating P-type ATPase